MPIHSSHRPTDPPTHRHKVSHGLASPLTRLPCRTACPCGRAGQSDQRKVALAHDTERDHPNDRRPLPHRREDSQVPRGQVITLAILIDLHAAALRSGGVSGVRDQGALEGALAKPYAGWGDMELYPGLHDKAAALMIGVAKAHGFVDANKRTALLATAAFCRMNGYPRAGEALLSNLGESIVLLVAASVLDDVDVISAALARIVGD